MVETIFFVKLGLGAIALNLGMLWILNQKPCFLGLNNVGEAGDAGAGGSGGSGGSGGDAGGKTFTQEQVNHMMAEHKRTLQSELSTLKEQTQTYQEQLNKYKTAEESKTQQELEAQKQYEELKKGWQSKEQQYQSQLSEKENAIRDMRVTNALTESIIQNNAHPDAVQLIKALASIDDKGVITIKGRDANGIEQALSVEDGVKAFLKDKPFLVKANGQGGAGTSPAAGVDGSTGSGGNDPMADAKALQEAMASGNRQKVNEIKARIAAKRASQPVTLVR